MADEMAWKWSKDPKPEKLLELPELVRTAGLAAMKETLPEAVRWVVRRVRNKGVIIKNGKPSRVPSYSGAYLRRLKREGKPTKPNYSYSGTMLNHVRGRVAVKGGTIVGTAAPYGRVKGRERAGVGKRKGLIYRKPYSYVDRHGNTVKVKGQWIQPRGQAKGEGDSNEKRRPNKIVYNAHLMNLLVSRKGDGKWLSARIATHHILALAPGELRKFIRRMQASYEPVAAEVLARTAGKVK